ncbi:MAG: hypothetical protein JXB47_12560 [Anaerolineae bacterium]|nr:hypothetical protein [Anaerolineae bacterium]
MEPATLGLLLLTGTVVLFLVVYYLAQSPENRRRGYITYKEIRQIAQEEDAQLREEVATLRTELESLRAEMARLRDNGKT